MEIEIISKIVNFIFLKMVYNLCNFSTTQVCRLDIISNEEQLKIFSEDIGNVCKNSLQLCLLRTDFNDNFGGCTIRRTCRNEGGSVSLLTL